MIFFLKNRFLFIYLFIFYYLKLCFLKEYRQEFSLAKEVSKQEVDAHIESRVKITKQNERNFVSDKCSRKKIKPSGFLS
jgi:hypothetical protein